MNTSDVISVILGITAMIGIFIYGFIAVFRTRQLIDFYIKSNRGKYSLGSNWSFFKKLADRQEKMYKSDSQPLKLKIFGVFMILISILLLILNIRGISNLK